MLTGIYGREADVVPIRPQGYRPHLDRFGGGMFGRGKPNDYDSESLAQRASIIETRDDFVRFAQLLTQNYRKRRGDWENDKLDRYLEAVASFSSDFDGYVKNTGRNDAENPWRLLASVLLAAKVYE